ncbi:MAG: exodeoxyribonuclease VII large subunit [Pseudomonadota bacterium]
MSPASARSIEVGGNTPEFTVSELSQGLKKTIETAYDHVRVRGEIGRVSRPASGHVYLDLKDDRSVLSGVCWKGVAARLRVQPEQGLEVVATGRLTTFPGQSKYQIIVEALEPAGVGALMALLEERKKKLEAEGLFDTARKRALPYAPKVVGIVTSPSGAVIRDMMHGFNERFPTQVLVWPVRVQGEASAGEVAAAVRGFNTFGAGLVPTPPRPDVLIVARGGGSLEDLWSFNEEIVARAVAESEIPVISAVGHETDWTLIDFVADARAPTPTKAAEWAVPRLADLLDRLGELDHRLRLALRRQLDGERTRLTAATRGLPRLTDLLALPRQRLDGVAARLTQAHAGLMQQHAHRLARLDGRLHPDALRRNLQRGREITGALSDRQVRAADVLFRQRRQQLDARARALDPRSLQARIASEGDRLRVVRGRVGRALGHRLSTTRGRVDALGKLLDSLSYHGVLARGFALVRSGDGTPIRSAKDASAGLPVRLEWSDGLVVATVEGDGAGWPRRKRSTTGAEDKENQGDLF